MKLLSVSKAVIKRITIGRDCSQDEFNERYDICSQCPFFKRPDNLVDTTIASVTKINFKCNKCGCNGKKLWWTTENCPINKWNMIVTNN